jgi:uncharacterized protein (DUF58 family)
VELTPALRQRLGRAQLVAPRSLASGGVGDRRSGARGEGIEFEEHRPFVEGDDARRIDPHLFGRFGAPFVREYNVSQQLTVTLLIDASRSMVLGSPTKLDVARVVASGLAFVALSSADAVQVGAWSDSHLAWRHRVSGAGRLDDVERWLAGIAPRGESDLLAAAQRAASHLPRRGFAVLISDLWSETAQAAIDALGASEQSVLVIQVLAPEEVDPGIHEGSVVRMIDVETAEEVDVLVDSDAHTEYVTLLGLWTEGLRQRSLSVQGTFVRVTTDQSPEDLFLRTLPSAGVLR